MYEIQVPVSNIPVVPRDVDRLHSSVVSFVDLFCKYRLSEQGISMGRHSKMVFDSSHSIGFKKVLVRFINIMRSDILKSLPYLSHTAAFTSLSNIDRYNVGISVSSGENSPFVVNLKFDDILTKERIQDELNPSMFVNSRSYSADSTRYVASKYIEGAVYRSLLSYCHMFNHLMVKRGLPFFMGLRNSFISVSDYFKVDYWEDGTGCTIRWTGLSTVNLVLGIHISGQSFSWSSFLPFRFLSENGTRKMKDGIDSLYSRGNYPMISFDGEGHAPEIILEDLDSIRRILSSISRKLHYGHSAFSIGSPKDT